MRTLLCVVAASSLIALIAGSVRADSPPAAGRFTDVTDASGVGGLVAAHWEASPKWWLSGLALVDLDGDGDLDLHLASHAGPTNPAMAAANDGKGHFVAADPKPAVPRGPGKRADLPYPGGEIRLPFDVDEDGRLDLLCSWHDGGGALYMNATPLAKGEATGPAAWNFRRPEGADPVDAFSRATAVADLDGDGFVDYLHDEQADVAVYRGRGVGRFDAKPVLIPALKESGAIPVDLDGDGKPDLLVSQRGYNATARRIFHNDSAAGMLRFTDVTKDSGLDEASGGIHGVGDLNGDGSPDLVCVEAAGGNGKALTVALYFNDGHGRFARQPDAIAGLDKAGHKPESTNWGGAVVVDLDNDGVPDVLVNGRHFLYVLHGLGGGRFELANEKWGVPFTDWSAVDEGLCFGDVDGDGRLDLVVCGPGPNGKEKGVRVLHNDLSAAGAADRHWLRVRLAGKAGNRAATGARVRLYEPGTDKLVGYEQVAAWGRQSFHSYYGAAQTERHFGLGSRGAVDVSVEFYPSGKKVVQRGAKADGIMDVRED